MSKIEQLEIIKKRIDIEIEKYLDRAIKEIRGRDILMAEALGYVREIILSGGKRLRPAFMYYGYLAASGKEREKILKTAVSIELIHMFLLIHDDIIDRDETRHGKDAIHHRYAKIGKKLFRDKDPDHFGSSMGIIIGDMVGALGNQIIFESGFAPERIMKALHKMQSIVAYTVVGEAQDVFIEYKKKATEEEIMRMYENKTAKYTIEGPLQLGAILGGADDALLSQLSAYSIPIGIAFQIQDDILGAFGDQKKLGKKVGSDIAQGKQTILVARALKFGSSKQRKRLSELLGNQQTSKNEIREFQELVRDTGALDYANDLARTLIFQGKSELEKMKISKEVKKFLADVADFMLDREL